MNFELVTNILSLVLLKSVPLEPQHIFLDVLNLFTILIVIIKMFELENETVCLNSTY